MKQADIVLGRMYIVKVSGSLVQVRVNSWTDGWGSRRDKWTGINLQTGREVRGTAAKLRREVVNR